MRKPYRIWLPLFLACLIPAVTSAQTPPVEQGGGSFMPQCPSATIRHPATGGVNPAPATGEAQYTGPVTRTVSQDPTGVWKYSPSLTIVDNGGALKCQQISGGDGMMTEADGNQTFMFSFGPLSGLSDIENGLPGTEYAATFRKAYCDPLRPSYNSGQPNPNYTTVGCISGSDPNGAVGNVVAPSFGVDSAAIMNTGVLNGNIPGPLFAFDEDDEFIMSLTNVGMIMRPDLFEQHTVHFHGYPNASSFYDGVPDATIAINIGGTFSYYYWAPDAGTYFWHCHITPPEHLQMGMVGWLYVRPRQNRIPDGTDPFMSSTVWEEKDLRTACKDTGVAWTGGAPPDILCSAPQPAKDAGFVHHTGIKYVYDDGDGSTAYDVDVPLQIHGFDPNFHFVGMTFNPEGFSDMKDKYFLLNGRSYPDTIGVNPASTALNGNTLPSGWAAYWANGGVPGGCTAGPIPNAGPPNPNPCTNAISTIDTDTLSRPSQPHSALIVLSNSQGNWCKGLSASATCGQRAALRIADLDVQEYQTLSSVGIPMLLVGFNAKILRDQAGNNLFIKTNSITLGGGESLDVIIDSTGVPPGTYYLYTPQLDHLSNDAENFGGLVTEVVVTP